MATIAIFPLSNQSEPGFVALTPRHQSIGKTPGQALDALTEQLPYDELGTMIIVQRQHADRFFGAAQQDRLQTMMDSWRHERDEGAMQLGQENDELRTMVEAELRAAADRAAELNAEKRS